MRSIKLGIITGACVFLLAGCSPFINTNKPQWKIGQTVQTSTLPSAVVQFVDKAGQRIGDVHPKITRATTDIDDATQKHMYRLEITGDFTYMSHHATELSMIVDADGGAGAFVYPNDNAFNQINLNKSH
ncbi:hypothetical protein LLE49_27930 [Alicyclobacillus tolerans]|uniref:hypothetical protein n=1 Tax=Alicyclobacillus tolerans TaxID=90970 RepID=UPI001F2B17E4|nr:hypothetical protein [Alicyclobacillus tolerans]MCF8568553.1 hypothetical protein [Alicyclobacillus tolerans]